MKLNILQKFTLLSAVATAVVAAAMGLLVSVALSRNLLSREAEVTAQALRTVTSVDLPPETFARAAREHDDARFRYIWGHFQQLPEVFRLKIYDPTGKIVWSDEARLIGKLFADNEELEKALRGEVTVEMGKPKTEHEFERDIAPEGEILELYVPLLASPDNSVYAVVEIYRHPTAFLANRRHWLAIVWAATVGSGLVMFFSLFSLFRGALREQNRLYKIERQYAEMEFEMKTAGGIQRGLLPRLLPDAPGYALAAFHQPSREIGGDHYDAYRLSDGTLVLSIADNEGRGIPGALLMAETHALMQSQAEMLARASDVVRLANRTLNATARPGLFVTGIVAKLDPTSRRLTYCNAGHPPGLVARDGKVIRLDKGGLPMGVEATEEYEEGALTLEPGDALLLYTDGLTEAVSREEEFFGDERLVRALLSAVAKKAPETILAEVNRTVEEFRGGAESRDDMAMLCMVVKT